MKCAQIVQYWIRAVLWVGPLVPGTDGAHSNTHLHSVDLVALSENKGGMP